MHGNQYSLGADPYFVSWGSETRREGMLLQVSCVHPRWHEEIPHGRVSSESALLKMRASFGI